MTNLEKAKLLRQGISLSFCDAMIRWKNGEFIYSWMGLNASCTNHQFCFRRMSWREVLSCIKGGWYR